MRRHDRRAPPGPERGLRGAELEGARRRRRAERPRLAPPVELVRPVRDQHGRGLDRGRRARRARRPRRGRGRARQRRGVRALRALPAGARPAPQHLHPPLGLHPARPPPERRATGTAPTWPARSPRRPTTASAPPGIAYSAKIMPLRVLDSRGEGDSAAIARAIRYAVRYHADVINLSLEFPAEVRSAEIPDVRQRAPLRAPARRGGRGRGRQPGRRRRWRIPRA